MIRALVIVAVAGFLMSVACISAAVAIGGPEAIARSAWSWNWDWSDGPRHFGVWRHGAQGHEGPTEARDFPWSGGDRLVVNAPAQIDYVQAPGPARLTIRGDRRTLDLVRVEGGQITLAPGRPDWSQLHITLTAPDVTRFELNGADSLNITATSTMSSASAPAATARSRLKARPGASSLTSRARAKRIFRS